MNPDVKTTKPPQSRRSALQLILADAAALIARPSHLLAAGPRIELKYYHTAGGKSRLIYAEPLAAPVVDAFKGRSGGEIELFWYDGHGTLLGRTRLSEDLQAKLERVGD
jgi:hypothetical protein